MKNFKVKSGAFSCKTKILETTSKLKGDIEVLDDDNKNSMIWKGKNASTEVNNLKKIVSKSIDLLDEIDKLDI